MKFSKKKIKILTKKKAVFLDRDGVINYDFGYVYKKEEFIFKKNVIEAIKCLNKNNYFIFIVSNQSSICRGYYSKKDVDQKFSGMINALSYGAPPHGGIAPGIDRIVMLLANEKNIREVTMFPMNQNAQDLMMNAPSIVDENQLKELNLSIKPKK